MLKSRLIPCIMTKGNLVVQSYNFKKFLPIGDVKTAIEFFVNWDVDEIVLVDIDATREGRSPNIELIEWAATECFVPLCVGGGIKNISDIKRLLNAGADKVCINSVIEENTDFIRQASDIFGAQCITASIDVVLEDDDYRVFSHKEKEASENTPVEWAKMIEKQGAGEIFLNSVDRDGSRQGYDIKLLKLISEAVSIPIIACGGVGKVAHLSDAILEGGCQAAAAANIFQHTEHSTIAAKSHMLKSGVDVRLSSDVKYDDFKFDRTGRPL